MVKGMWVFQEVSHVRHHVCTNSSRGLSAIADFFVCHALKCTKLSVTHTSAQCYTLTTTWHYLLLGTVSTGSWRSQCSLSVDEQINFLSVRKGHQMQLRITEDKNRNIICKKIASFNRKFNLGKNYGTYYHISYAKRAQFQRCPIFRGTLCLQPLTQNDQIRHGNNCMWRSVFQEVSREPEILDISCRTYSPGHFSLEVFPLIKPEGRCFPSSVRWHMSKMSVVYQRRTGHFRVITERSERCYAISG